MKNETIRYYDRNADKFIENTRHVDFSDVQDRFLARIPAGGRILDFGCGAGRDTKDFLEKGYAVEAMDGSEELCRAASAYTGIPVWHALFQELDETDKYDGVWACASVLHLSSSELPDVFRRMTRALKMGGVIYASFKYGDFEGERADRYFTDMTEEKMSAMLRKIPALQIRDMWISVDVRPGRGDEKWLNLLAERVSTDEL